MRSLAILVITLLLILNLATASELLNLSTGIIRGGALLPSRSCRGPLPLLRIIENYLILKGMVKPVSSRLIDIYGASEELSSLKRGDPILICDGYLISTRACLLSNIISVNESYGTMLTSSGLKLNLEPEALGDALRARGKLALIWVDTWRGVAYRISLNRVLKCPAYPPDLQLTQEGDKLILMMSWRLEGDDNLTIRFMGLDCPVEGRGRRYICKGGVISKLKGVKIRYLGQELVYTIPSKVGPTTQR